MLCLKPTKMFIVALMIAWTVLTWRVAGHVVWPKTVICNAELEWVVTPDANGYAWRDRVICYGILMRKRLIKDKKPKAKRKRPESFARKPAAFRRGR